jgi:hypothetical protein
MTASQEIWNERRAHKRDQAPSIIGLAVQMPAPCSSCGSRLANIAADHVLQCECSVKRNPLSERTITFITEVVRSFGTPVDPIILRRKPSNQFRHATE